MNPDRKRNAKQKIYCYVDETGQDTKGEIFLVAVVVLAQDHDQPRRRLEQIEERSGKRSRKWTRSTPKQRESYIRSVLSHPELTGVLFYSAYPGAGGAYVDLTILSTARAINYTCSPDDRLATIYVDGLRRTEERRFASGLRQLGVKVHKVRGMKDQNDVFIRLADSIAGFVRDGLTGDQRMKTLYTEAVAAKKIHHV